jgi:hypothetical protein
MARAIDHRSPQCASREFSSVFVVFDGERWQLQAESAAALPGPAGLDSWPSPS